MFNKYKPAIIILTVALTIIFGTVEYVKYLINEPAESIPRHLQLKAPVEKILNSQKIKDEQDNDIVKYLYVSETEVLAKTIKIDNQEIKEDISRRTKNALFFPSYATPSAEATDVKKASEDKPSYAKASASAKATADKSEDKKEIWIGRFYVGQPFYKDASKNKWYQTETATTTAEEFSRQTKPNFLARVKDFFGMDVLADTVSPFAGAGDGVCYLASQATWDAAHDAEAAGTANYTDTWVNTGNLCVYLTSVSYQIARWFFPIDTSGIDDGATITEAKLKIFIDSVTNTDDDGEDYFNVVQTSQASCSHADCSDVPPGVNCCATLVVGDYDQCGSVNTPTVGATAADISGITVEQYTELLLDETGRGWINKTGYTKLGVREGHDILDHAIATPPQWNVYQNAMKNYYSEETDTDKDPYLEVTWIAEEEEGSTAKTQINSPLTNKYTSGLVGHWTFNGADMDWASSTAEALDRSGQENNGNVIGAKAAIGKVGQGMEFDGVGDYVDCGDVYNGIKTISFWIKAGSLTEKIIDLNGTADIEVVNGIIIANNFSPTIYVDGSLGSTIDTDWHYVTVATSTAVNASAVDIGRIGADYFDGLLDEVRIYNYALSADEILKHYRVWSRKMLIDPNKEYKTIIKP